jgi:hypothetical protein
MTTTIRRSTNDEGVYDGPDGGSGPKAATPRNATTIVPAVAIPCVLRVARLTGSSALSPASRYSRPSPT